MEELYPPQSVAEQVLSQGTSVKGRPRKGFLLGAWPEIGQWASLQKEKAQGLRFGVPLQSWNGYQHLDSRAWGPLVTSTKQHHHSRDKAGSPTTRIRGWWWPIKGVIGVLWWACQDNHGVIHTRAAGGADCHTGFPPRSGGHRLCQPPGGCGPSGGHHAQLGPTTPCSNHYAAQAWSCFPVCRCARAPPVHVPLRRCHPARRCFQRALWH